MWLLNAAMAASISVLGIIKAPQQDGCAQAWLLPTDPRTPTPHCLDFSAFTPEQQQLLRRYFDEEVVVSGPFVEGALSVRHIATQLDEYNGSHPALDYHLSPVTGSRSHDIGRRLQENTVHRLRIQTPPMPISLEFIFQGVTSRDELPAILDALTFRLGDQVLVPETRSFGQTVFFVIPSLPPDTLLVIESPDNTPLHVLLGERLFSGDASQMSLTMLLGVL